MVDLDPNQRDRDWCHQAAHGDEAAAERLLEAHYARVFAYHRRQVSSDAVDPTNFGVSMFRSSAGPLICADLPSPRCPLSVFINTPESQNCISAV
jgi:hypothetical protein